MHPLGNPTRLWLAHGQPSGQLAQEKRPLEPHPPPELYELAPAYAPDEPDAKAETFFWVSGLEHSGQAGGSFVSDSRAIISNVEPQVLQRYS